MSTSVLSIEISIFRGCNSSQIRPHTDRTRWRNDKYELIPNSQALFASIHFFFVFVFNGWTCWYKVEWNACDIQAPQCGWSHGRSSGVGRWWVGITDKWAWQSDSDGIVPGRMRGTERKRKRIKCYDDDFLTTFIHHGVGWLMGRKYGT